MTNKWDYQAAAGTAVHRRGTADSHESDFPLAGRGAAGRRGAVHHPVQHAGGYLHQLLHRPHDRYRHRRSLRAAGQLGAAPRAVHQAAGQAVPPIRCHSGH